MKKLFLLLFVIFNLWGCSTTKNYKNEIIGNNYINGKTIYFSLSEASRSVTVDLEGPAMGTLRQPDVRKAFQTAVEELAKETKLDLRYTDTAGADTASGTYVTAHLNKINWLFTFSSATMNADIKYVANGKDYHITGSFKNMGGGNEGRNLKRSFKNANFQLLKSLDR